MSFAHILKETRKNNEMTQKTLALEVGIDQSRISAYERGEEIPNDIALNIIRVLYSPRLSLAFNDKRKSEVVNIPVPTNFNDDVVNVLDVVIEESVITKAENYLKECDLRVEQIKHENENQLRLDL